MGHLTTGKYSDKVLAVLRAQGHDAIIIHVSCWNFRSSHCDNDRHTVKAVTIDGLSGRQIASIVKNAGLMTANNKWID